MQRFASARPYDFPYDGSLSPESTALLSIDMQRDFLDEGGYVHVMGYELAPLRRTIAPSRAVMEAALRELCVRHVGGLADRSRVAVTPIRPARPGGQSA